MEKDAKIAIGILLLIIAFAIFLSVEENKARDKSCKELGFEEFIYYDKAFCEDSEGNLHYIKLDCPFPPFTRCISKPISVGDVRVK